MLALQHSITIYHQKGASDLSHIGNGELNMLPTYFHQISILLLDKWNSRLITNSHGGENAKRFPVLMFLSS